MSDRASSELPSRTRFTAWRRSAICAGSGPRDSGFWPSANSFDRSRSALKFCRYISAPIIAFASWCPITSNCFSARSHSPEKHESSKRKVRAASFVGFVLTSFKAASTAPVKFPASNCNLASFIELVVGAGSAISFHEVLRHAHLTEYRFIEKVIAARLYCRGNCFPAYAEREQIL